MTPADLPDPESHPHGTRARYVAAKCRCDDCRAANAKFARDCAARAKARALAAATGTTAAPAPQIWTAPDGSKQTRVYKRLCAGIGGQPCPTKSHLRKDSTGDICGKCRIGLAYAGLVSSDRAREHLLKLGKAGIGKIAVRDACDVSSSMLHEIRLGRYPRIRVETERRILAVDHEAIADHAVIDGRRTHRAIAEMVRKHGLTKTEIAQRLGYKAPALQIKRRVLAKTEARVLRLLAEVRREIAAGNQLPEICPDCGLSHAAADRQRVIARMLPTTIAEVHDGWPCLYANTNTGYMLFLRDRRALESRALEGQP
jgi:hypothetical protein